MRFDQWRCLFFGLNAEMGADTPKPRGPHSAIQGYDVIASVGNQQPRAVVPVG
jgi:hypothetical protein